jgi:predicted double-glycine peptidase
VLTTPLSRLRLQSVKVLVSILMVLATIKLSVWPFLAPVFNHEQLSQLQTRLDANDICRQNTDFTCGPASAVTVLRKLGLSADEGEVAILAHSSSVIGTPPEMLAQALQKRYGSNGLVSEYRVFRSISELKQSGFTLAVTKYRPWVDHYVAVLGVTNSQVVIGDPLLGLRRVAERDFEEIWRFEGVTLMRPSTDNNVLR